MGRTRHRSIGTPWFRAFAALGLVMSGVIVWLAYSEDVPGWMRAWILLGAAGEALTSGLWLVTGKTLRMKVGEIAGDRAPRRPSSDGTLFASKADARWWLAAMSSFVLALLGAALVLAAGLSHWWLAVPLGLTAAVSGFYRWWFWPAWTAGESEGSVTRLLWRPGWQTDGGWSAETWREAFEVAGLPVSQVPKARATFFTLLAGGVAAAFLATEAANPEEYSTAGALIRDLEAEGPFWACNDVDVDRFGYERAPYELDAALCRRTGDRMFVHVYRVGAEVEGPVLVRADDSIYTAWVQAPRWIVETTDRATAEEIADAIGGRVTTERPVE